MISSLSCERADRGPRISLTFLDGGLGSPASPAAAKSPLPFVTSMRPLRQALVAIFSGWASGKGGTAAAV